MLTRCCKEKIKRFHRGSSISEIALLDTLSQEISGEEISRLSGIIEQLVKDNQGDVSINDGNLVKVFNSMYTEGKRIAREKGVLISAASVEYAFCQIYGSKIFNISTTSERTPCGYFENTEKGICVPASFLYLHYFGGQFGKTKVLLESVEYGFREAIIIEAFHSVPYKAKLVMGDAEEKPLNLIKKQPWEDALDSTAYDIHGELFCTPYKILKDFMNSFFRKYPDSIPPDPIM